LERSESNSILDLFAAKKEKRKEKKKEKREIDKIYYFLKDSRIARHCILTINFCSSIGLE
jgi:hypothetical protein